MEGSSNSNSRGFSDRNTEFPPVDECVRSMFGSSTHKPSSEEEDSLGVDPFVRSLEWGDVSLRQWLDKPERSVDVLECLHVFRQIVEIVNAAHSQGIVVHNVKPSCFVMSSFNHVSFIESASCSDSGSEDGQKEEKGSYNKILERQIEKLEEEKKQRCFPMKHVLAMETSWYTSPEEEFGSPSTCASDVYRLGVLLFEVCDIISNKLLAAQPTSCWPSGKKVYSRHSITRFQFLLGTTLYNVWVSGKNCYPEKLLAAFRFKVYVSLAAILPCDFKRGEVKNYV